MSLDVYLYSHPDDANEQFWANITHNLNKMADAAGIYECVWRPDENGYEKAAQIVEPLQNGIELLKSNPARFREFNATNGWGTYDQFIPWLETYLSACKELAHCYVRVSR